MNLLDKTEELFHSVKVSVIKAAAALYACNEEGAWASKYSSWGEFVENLGISQSAASKMLKSFRHFAIEGGVSHAKLAEIDTEKLYLATSLEGTPEEQIEKAMVLSRQELRSQKIFEKTGEECVHEEIHICRKCHQRLG